MASRTVTAMFDRYSDAAKAVNKLEAAGVPHADISIVSNDSAERDRHSTATTGSHDHDATEKGTGTGASLGTVLGGGAGLLAGLGLLAIPGLGPVVAAGWLASTLVGAGAGAATGGVVGALTGLGVDESHAHSYAEGISRGGTLVTVKTDDDRVSTVSGILDDDGTVDLAERESSWRSSGWDGRFAGVTDMAGKGSQDYAPGTTGALSGGPIGAAASTTTGLGMGGTATPTAAGSTAMPGGSAGLGVNVPPTVPGSGRVRSYPV